MKSKAYVEITLKVSDKNASPAISVDPLEGETATV